MNMTKSAITVGTVRERERESYTSSRIKINYKEEIDFKSKSKSIYFVVRKINGFILAFLLPIKHETVQKYIKKLSNGRSGALCAP